MDIILLYFCLVRLLCILQITNMGKINTCFGYRDIVELAEQKQWYLNLGGMAVFIKSQCRPIWLHFYDGQIFNFAAERWNKITSIWKNITSVALVSFHWAVQTNNYTVSQNEGRHRTLPARYIHSEWKKQLLPITSPNVYRFSKFFSGRLSGKFESHLKYVATPPCEISVFKNIDI